MRLGRRDRGSVTIEMAIVAPVAVIMIMIVAALGRVNMAILATDSAAYEAARAASIARSETAANAAEAAARATLRDQGLSCNPVLDVDTSGFRTPVGQPAVVRVTVTCSLAMDDLFAVFGDERDDFDGLISLRSTFISPLDTYRSRT